MEKSKILTKRGTKTVYKIGIKAELRRIMQDIFEERIKDKLDYLDCFPKENPCICRYISSVVIYRRVQLTNSKPRIRRWLEDLVKCGEVEKISARVQGRFSQYALTKFKGIEMQDYLVDVHIFDELELRRLKKNDLVP